MVMNVELQATCSALGCQEKGKGYVREPDCLETVKDLIRFLKREDDTFDVRRELGHAQILQNDLLPILHTYHKERNLFEAVVRLLVNLTQPAILCFRNVIPEDKTMRNYYLEIESDLQSYKDAFVDDQLFSVLTEKLGDLLKLDWEHRHEEDRLLIERLLILIRNVLHVPPNMAKEQRTDDDASTHDQLLWTMHTSGMEDLLLYVASSDEERQLSLHVLEIVSLMFREQSPEMLACAGVQRSMTEKEKDERELELIREQELAKKRAALQKFSTRHSRFGGTYVVKNMTSISEKEMIYHKAQADVDNIRLDINKKPKKKPKNRAPIKDQEVVRRSMLSIRLSLKEFCVQFLENCYNPLMYAVKDILNREKSQEHDETYYLWSMRFFMEFCRHHSKQVELVSETLSVPTFHYIQVQLFNYYEMAMTDKKEAKVWGKRMHLALKAYQELLMMLNTMDISGNTQLMESSKVIKNNVFYMMEFRDIFLTLLKKFDESKQSRTYLKDLVETTHLFLKMLEKFCKGSKHFIVQKKKKKTQRKKKPKQAVEQSSELTDEQLDDMWADTAGELSAIFQGRSDVPDDVTPFDAASEVEFDQQRVEAVIKIQDALREGKPGEAVALFRAAREVWPENDQFGSTDISPEDEFMALREIFMTHIPRQTDEAPLNPEDFEEMDDEVEEEEIQSSSVSESEFSFNEFVVKFTKAEVIKVFVLLLADFQKNSTYTNHCIVKMLHRLAIDLGCVGMMFQASLFRVFQQILLSPLAKTTRYKEIAKFATFIIGKFVEAATKNKKIFMELLFWKGSRDAQEIIDGYGSSSNSSRVKMLWTEDQELELARLWDEYKDEEGIDIVDCIMKDITDDTKTRSQIIRELKRQELISSAKELKKKTGGSRAGPWREEHEMELRVLFERFRDSNDPVGNILENMTVRRGKAKVLDKILSMGLVHEKRELYKKRSRGKKNKSDTEEPRFGHENDGFIDDSEENDKSDGDISDSGDSGSDDSSDSGAEMGKTGSQKMTGEQSTHENTSAADIIRSIVDSGYREQINWIQRLLRRAAEDRDDGDVVSIPIVPLTEENETAMEDERFMTFLKRVGISPPVTGQEAFWRIPDALDKGQLENIADGLELDADGKPINVDKIPVITCLRTDKGKKKVKKQRKEVVKKKNSERFEALRAMAKKKEDEKASGIKKRRKRRSHQDRDKSVSGDEDNVSENLQQVPENVITNHLENSEAQSNENPSHVRTSRKVQRVVESDSDDSDVERDPEDSNDVRDSSQPVCQSQSQKRPLVFGSDSEDDSGGEKNNTQRSKRPRLFNSDESSDEDIPLAKNQQSESFPATMLTQPPGDSDSDNKDHIPLRKVLQKRKIIESDDSE
ncbi:hypothetical protein ScPMuIL_012096 [Solemya velum]